MRLVDARKHVAEAMSERELQESVRLLCVAHGLLYYHTHNSRHSPAGWPDVVVANPREPGAILFRELKSHDGKVTPAQQEWLDVLAGAHLDVGVWRPADLLSGAIERQIGALR